MKLQHTATHCNTLQHTAAHCNRGCLLLNVAHTMNNCLTFEKKNHQLDQGKKITSWISIWADFSFCPPPRHSISHIIVQWLVFVSRHIAHLGQIMVQWLFCVPPHWEIVEQASFICTTWLIHTCYMTHSYVWHDSFICVTWLIHMCDMPHSYATWLIHMCDMIHSHVTWLIHMCHESFICDMTY